MHKPDSNNLTFNCSIFQGRKWIETVRKCLMQAVLKYWASPSKTCETIKEFAFDSHPDCYVVPGKTDICSILFSDAKTLFTDVYDLADLFTMSGVQQVNIIFTSICFIQSYSSCLLYVTIIYDHHISRCRTSDHIACMCLTDTSASGSDCCPL